MTDLAAVPQPGDPHARPGTRPKENTVAYTDADVRLVALALINSSTPPRSDFLYNVDLPEVEARAALNALAVAGRLLPAEPVNDIEATGRCCCAGCAGMGPCDRELGRSDDD
ncbi:hypothetical protein [Micromonospora sp. C41]|uniref:hypothetical protein n=1 Tax=Micromonospora sp. C41 TaxID=2824878 RepID=UPI001B392C4E|nr:hypothetical protein [Micromonospora sp. C41]MBQ1064494.1 hypothetical protein [Micromonospora sp. C41]